MTTVTQENEERLALANEIEKSQGLVVLDARLEGHQLASAKVAQVVAALRLAERVQPKPVTTILNDWDGPR